MKVPHHFLGKSISSLESPRWPWPYEDIWNGLVNSRVFSEKIPSNIFMQFYSNAKRWLPSSLKFSMQPVPLKDQSSALELHLTLYTYLNETRITNLVTANCNQNVALTFFLSDSQSTGGPWISRIHYIRFLVKLVWFLTIVRFLALILAKIQIHSAISDHMHDFFDFPCH